MSQFGSCCHGLFYFAANVMAIWYTMSYSLEDRYQRSGDIYVPNCIFKFVDLSETKWTWYINKMK
jgi:hypothetical protein